MSITTAKEPVYFNKFDIGMMYTIVVLGIASIILGWIGLFWKHLPVFTLVCNIGGLLVIAVGLLFVRYAKRHPAPTATEIAANGDYQI